MEIMPCFYSPLTWLVIVSCFISMRSASRAVSMLADEDPEMIWLGLAVVPEIEEMVVWRDVCMASNFTTINFKTVI